MVFSTCSHCHCTEKLFWRLSAFPWTAVYAPFRPTWISRTSLLISGLRPGMRRWTLSCCGTSSSWTDQSWRLRQASAAPRFTWPPSFGTVAATRPSRTSAGSRSWASWSVEKLPEARSDGSRTSKAAGRTGLARTWTVSSWSSSTLLPVIFLRLHLN